jgi:hypothetical protein
MGDGERDNTLRNNPTAGGAWAEGEGKAMIDPDPIELVMREIQRINSSTTTAGPNPFAAEPAADVDHAISEPELQKRNETENSPAPKLANLPRDTAVALRWTLRDIRGKRLSMSPIDQGHLNTLIMMGLVEMRDEQPVLTNAGLDAIV